MSAPSGFGVSRWTALLLAIPITFSVWSVSLVVSVKSLRTQVEHDVGLTARFGRFEQALRALSQAVTVTGNRADAGGPRKTIDDTLVELGRDDTDAGFLMTELERTRGLVASLESDAPAGGAARSAVELAQFRSQIDRIVESTQAAVAHVRLRLASVSETLGHKWNQLNIVAMASIVLAMAVIVLLAVNERTRREQQRLAGEVRRLQGLLPICAWCRKIRDEDSWLEIEAYIARHSEAQFTHGICPECMKNVLGDAGVAGTLPH